MPVQETGNPHTTRKPVGGGDCRRGPAACRCTGAAHWTPSSGRQAPLLPLWMSSPGPCALVSLQVIQATMEQHKQNSQSFKAFSSSFGQDEATLTPELPVSARAPGSWEGLLTAHLDGE